ncbi:hypothetical protein V6N11_024187 [Hibiscus sabdariffa]|uniref:Uncharacterized protein n=2 Tax=Hibiscus sabdariffa TaxID=183260 RepID=A0ABR2BWY9_9ROSI
MALETVVFQQDPFSYGCQLKDSFSIKQEDETTSAKINRGFAVGATCSSSDHNGFAPPEAPHRAAGRDGGETVLRTEKNWSIKG